MTQPQASTPDEIAPVVVEWLDSTMGSTGWAPYAQLRAETLKPIRSSGFLLQETETLVTLVASISGDRGADTLLIPRGCVLNIRRLKE